MIRFLLLRKTLVGCEGQWNQGAKYILKVLTACAVGSASYLELSVENVIFCFKLPVVCWAISATSTNYVLPLLEIFLHSLVFDANLEEECWYDYQSYCGFRKSLDFLANNIVKLWLKLCWTTFGGENGWIILSNFRCSQLLSGWSPWCGVRGGSGSDISLQAPNSKFEAKLESKGELSYWVFTQPIYFAFNNFHIMVLCHFFGRAYFLKQKYWFQI